MSRIWLIIKREYITRVRKLSFIITTLLAPLGIALLLGAQFFFMSYTGDISKIAVVDNSNISWEKLENSKSINYFYVNENEDSLKQNYQAKGYEGVLFIPTINVNEPSGIVYHSENLLSITAKKSIEGKLSGAIKDIKYKNAGISNDKLKSFKTNINIKQTGLNSDAGTDTIVATVSSYLTGFIIYFILIMYGTMVMRGVAEEKNNRIIEVIMSSTKPFKLMMGKIIGIGLVGLTQFLLWIILGLAVIATMSFLFADQIAAGSQTMVENANLPEGMEMGVIYKLFQGFGQVNVWPILTSFVFYFFGGYFFYAAFFAAIGTATGEDNETSQSLTLIVTVPLIIAIFMSMGVINAPNSPLSVIGSIIPFFSPIVMPARIPFGVPFWQLALSAVSLIVGFILATWLAAKIYRIGILIYGKKITARELGKWLFYKG